MVKLCVTCIVPFREKVSAVGGAEIQRILLKENKIKRILFKYYFK